MGGYNLSILHMGIFNEHREWRVEKKATKVCLAQEVCK